MSDEEKRAEDPKPNAYANRFLNTATPTTGAVDLEQKEDEQEEG